MPVFGPVQPWYCLVNNCRAGNKNFDFLLLGCKLAAETVESSYLLSRNTGFFQSPIQKQSITNHTGYPPKYQKQ
jgi:hypothetical protein